MFISSVFCLEQHQEHHFQRDAEYFFYGVQYLGQHSFCGFRQNQRHQIHHSEWIRCRCGYIKKLASDAWNWGRDIIQGIIDGIQSAIGWLADGIDKSKKYVEKAIGGVAKALQLTMDSDLNYSLHGISGAMLPDSSGGTVNNYYNTNNSRTVN